ncbi:hypothetical protein BELL_0080g00300 [Botrytis elliptica]|uniref:Aminoglycoside phosphotransferase domain-containing protein n=1 Tax=Botrytis elliptica TaxID=278938 RepID=A0A4Z1K2B0_9HELO|nr:hypothetical protein EAE99_007310 [Botrytis elliptica]TGO78080.1 hypothetical protein BELL_0080g00300 [Botrytis elliptica]
MAANHNHAKYQSRLDYIQQLLVDHLRLPSNDLQQIKITPIQYEPDCPFKYNNFVYRLVLPGDTLGGPVNVDGGHKLQQPECVDIPVDALCYINPPIVPRIFGWGGAGCKHVGWILQELMPGIPIGEAFGGAMSLDQKRGILAQMAGLLKALQDYPLPKSIHGFGGATFNDSGAIVSGPMTSVGAGPWDNFEDCYRGRLKVALTKADKNPYLQGWHVNGIRERIDAFIEHGLPSLFSHFPTKQDKSIIHADFTPDNLLYDPTTGRITALLDYDFASILHPAYEFFRSFGSNGGQFLGWSGDTTPQEIAAEALRNAKLTGQFPSPLPAPGVFDNGPVIDWEVAQAWEEELQKMDVKRRSNIPGIEKLADIDEILGALVLWRLCNEDFLSMNQDEDQRMALRRMSEEKLVGLLDHLGF